MTEKPAQSPESSRSRRQSSQNRGHDMTKLTAGQRHICRQRVAIDYMLNLCLVLARQDAHDRTRWIEKLRKTLDKGATPASLSPSGAARIQEALNALQISLIYETNGQRKFGLPSRATQDARVIDRTLGIKWNSAPFVYTPPRKPHRTKSSSIPHTTRKKAPITSLPTRQKRVRVGRECSALFEM